jgi:hypothetical protein
MDTADYPCVGGLPIVSAYCTQPRRPIGARSSTDASVLKQLLDKIHLSSLGLRVRGGGGTALPELRSLGSWGFIEPRLCFRAAELRLVANV